MLTNTEQYGIVLDLYSKKTTPNNVYTYNAIFNCLIKSDNLSTFFEIYDEMKQNGIQPDSAT